MTNIEKENADMIWCEPSLMSTLNPYPKDIFASAFISSRKKRYIESLMKNLITNLTESELYNDFDTYFMITIANHTFLTLSKLYCNYRTFYDAVKDYIRSQCQLSDANKLNKSQTERSLILKEIREADAMAVTIAKKLEHTITELLKAREEKKLLEKKLAVVNKDSEGLVKETDLLEKRGEETKVKHIKSINDLRKNKKVEQKCLKWSNEAKTGIDHAKAMFAQVVPGSTRP